MSVCHCLACQCRTGGPFSAQARFPADQVTVDGDWRVWERVAPSGRKAWYRWCPDCGATVAYVNEGVDDMVAVPIGAFADADFPSPGFSIYEASKHSWIEIVGKDMQHDL